MTEKELKSMQHLVSYLLRMIEQMQEFLEQAAKELEKHERDIV